MKKKSIIVGIIIAVLGGLSFGAYKYLGLGYKKVVVEALEVPKWRMTENITNVNYVKYVDEYDIVKSTDKLGGAAQKYYSKYIDYIAPNGKPIRILAMDQVTDEQVLYAYNMLSFYLTSNEKVDKRPIANKMAETGTTLILPNGADKDGKTPMAAMSLGQNLNKMEIANVGSKWYIDCDYEHRDAAFEEIFHMVHDYGIGTTKNPGANPRISTIIADAKDNALPKEKSNWGKKGLWGLNSSSWLSELEKEGSLEQEYIVSVIDSYYGLWEPWTDGKGGMWGIYTSKNRDEIAAKDPKGKTALESFLPENITQMMRIDPSFDGEFMMTQVEGKAYTYKSQYLQSVSLTGSKNSSISGNSLSNTFMVNSGENKVDGKSGYDIVQFRGNSNEYTIKKENGTTIVIDSVDGRDGKNILKAIEVLRFIDKDYKGN